MALLRKLFYRKPPYGLLEICDRVHVFDCCFTTDAWEEENYKVYIRGIVGQLRDHIPDASILVFNFHEGEGQSQIANFLSDFDMTIMDYPRHYEGCPLLTMEVIHHFLRSSESWLSLGPNNLLLMHCEQGGWPILAFMLAALLIYRKHYTGEQKTLEMIYKQSPCELLQCLSPLNPVPSQLRYLQYISRRNMASEWPPLDRALTLDCVIIRLVPDFDGERGCRPIFRIYGQDPFLVADRTPKLLFSTPKKSKTIRHYKQEECELVKIDINCHIQGDVVLECINLNDDTEYEEMIFRLMFNTAFIRSNILMLNRDEIDILWNAKDQFPKDFRAEVLFSDMDAAASVVTVDLSCFEEKDGLPVEAFAKVHEIFSHVDWLDPKTDAALNVLQQITASNVVQGRVETDSPGSVETSTSLQELITEKVQGKQKPASSEDNAEKFSSFALENKHFLSQKPSEGADVNERKAEPQLQERQQTAAMERETMNSTTFSIKNDSGSSSEPSTFADMSKKKPVSRYHSSSSATGITPLFPEYISSDPSLDFSDAHKSVEQKGVSISPPTPLGPHQLLPIQPTLTASATKTLASPPPPPPPPPVPQQLPQLPPHQFSASKSTHLTLAKQSEKYLLGRDQSSLVPPLPAPETPVASTSFHESSSNSTSPSPALIITSSTLPPPPPPPPPLKKNLSTRAVPPPPPPPPPSHSGKTTSPVPPPPPPAPAFSSKFNPALEDSSHVPAVPPPPATFSKEVSKMDAISPVSCSASGYPAPPAPCGYPAISNGRNMSRTISSRNYQTKKLKPLHWLKLTRAVSGSLWAETQKSGEASKAPEIDMSELESLFSAAAPKSDHGNSGGKSNLRAPAGSKFDKVQLIEHRRAYNCEIMLSKVKVPLHELMSSVLALEDSALDVDQVDNLIKFCPTKDEIELLKGYKGEKEKLGKCEQFLLELMQVPRVETKLRVFSFKIQFPSLVSYLRTSLNVVNSAAEEIKNSVKLKRIMQTILQLGNALNQGTSRGSAIGFRLDSLLKIADTRARNKKTTLMHYLCKVLADKLPEVLDFSKDLASLEPASKIQLKFLAEEMQAISKGLEKVMQELSSSENDGPISENFCKTLKKFLHFAETEVRSLASLYSGVGRNVDALILYFGEDPARCPFEQVISTLLDFVRMFNQAHQQNCKDLELKKKQESQGIA